MKDEVFNNTSRRVIRVFLAIAGGFALIGAVPLVVLWVLSFRGGASHDTRQSCLLAVWIISPLMLAMLFSALLTIPTARQADREFDQFRKGDLLARWEYSADFWLPYVEAETNRLRSVAKAAYWLIFGPMGAVAIYVGYFVARSASNRAEVWAIVAALLTILSAVYLFAAKAVIRFRRHSLLNCPRAYIGRTAIYCGGIFNFWGSQLRALYSVRQLPGHTPEHPGILEFVIGLSTGARRATAAINAVTMLAASPAYASSQSARQVIPIPPGEEARAAEIVELLRTPVHVAAPIEVPMHFSSPWAAPLVKPTMMTATKPPALSGMHHEPGSLHRKAVRWLVVTIVLLVGGLGLFVVGGQIDGNRPAGSGSSSLATFIDVVGLFAWVISPATGVLCLVWWFRSRREHRPRDSGAGIFLGGPDAGK